jgi:uncharacterized protein (TIGR02246 family)
MKNLKALLIIFISLLFLSAAYAGDKEDVQVLVKNAAEAFNQHNFTTYWTYFTDDNTEFPYVVSPLRHDAAAWKAFIEGTASLGYVNYHEQDYEIQVYNGDAAVITGYYTFTWMEKGEQMNYQSGRATMVAVKEGGKWLIAHMHFSEMF